jgi:SAM-dependent methyltransferase
MANWTERIEQRLAPRRRRGIEYLDSPDIDPAVRSRSHRDIDLSSALLGGSRALKRSLTEAMSDLTVEATLLDVGSGSGGTIALAQRLAAKSGIRLTGIALDIDRTLVKSCAKRQQVGVCGNALELPFRSGSVDLVVCSLLLHHFEGDALRQVLGELDRVARGGVIVHDLRRSRLAAAGLWALSFPLGFHPISRHDGVTSVLRGFTRDELRTLVYDSTGAHPRVSRHLGYRLVGSWRPERVDKSV